MDETSQHDVNTIRQRPSFFSKNRIWLNIVLFIATVFSTFIIGYSLSISYKYAGVSEYTLSLDMLFDPQIIFLNVVYSVVLLGILLSHELGHFLTARYYRIDATLPFFIPFPSLIGTMGAFIKIRSPITRKKQLFDIGVAGPLTGFILSVPALIIGLSLSKVVAHIPREGSFLLGEPLLLKLAGSVILKGGPPDADLILHPMAFAGWVGILVTALNLFPIGQLDGGHVFYALLGQKSRLYSRYILAAFIVMGIFFWVGWFVWAFLIGILGLKHPQIVDEDTPLSPRRKWIAFFILIIFILSFIPDPIKGFSLLDLIGGFPL